MKRILIRKLTIAGVLVAVAVVGSLFSIPVLGAKCFAGAAHGKCARRRSAGPVVRARHGLCSSTDSQCARLGKSAGVPRPR